jgi:hypothetical protein
MPGTPIPTLDASLAGEFSNSYVDQNYADDYFSKHFNTLKANQWNALSDDQKTQVLMQACWDIEQLRFTVYTDWTTPRVSDLQYNTKTGRFTAYVSPTMESAKYNFYQSLQFPRNKDYYQSGTLYIPPRMCMAQCEQAIYLVNFDETDMTNRLSGVSMEKVSIGRGQIDTTKEYSYQGTSLAPLTYEYVKPYLIWTMRTKRV